MPESNSYHHGDLRAALIDAATLEIERSGYEDISLRKLAIVAGVSHGAPYRHFASREALLVEIAIAGANRLRAKYEAIIRRPIKPRERVKEMCRANIDLAADQPQLFRLMFVSEIVKPKATWSGEWFKAMHDPLALFKDTIATSLRSKSQQLVNEITLSLWATTHGLAQLRMTGRVDLLRSAKQSEAALIDAVIERVLP